jgi:hypothetical protein
MHKNQDAWHRRHAIQLAAQLPEDTDDSLLIIDADARVGSAISWAGRSRTGVFRS